MSIPADNPIRRESDDLLGRAPGAAAFACQILQLDVSEGAVVGVLGRWGSGKTSYVNMAREKLVATDVPVLEFNPWMFSGTQQLVEAFFVEIGAQLRLRKSLAAIGDQLSDYGEAFAGFGWLPMVGPWIERGRGAAKVLGKFLSRRREGSTGRREELVKALQSLERPIVVVIDDIDRLTTPEIRDIFKLVRLTASFPNIVYVVAFDRERVEHALAEEGVPGRDYLEKILQVAVDLPAIPGSVLREQLLAALDVAIAGAASSAPLDEGVWPDVFVEVVAPLIRNMRDVRRYQLAVRGTLDDVGDRVALVDLLAMEAVRVFLPDVFHEIERRIDAFCTPSESLGASGPDYTALEKAGIELVIETGRERAAVVRSLVERLFPFAKRHLGGSHYNSDWLARFLRDRRVAHEVVLRFYFERVVGEELRNHYDAERVWEHMADKDALQECLDAVDPERREAVIHALEAYEGEFRPDQVVPSVVVLANIAHELPRKPRGMFDIDPSMTVHRVTYRLLRSLPSEDEVEKAVAAILPHLTTLSAKHEVVSQVGYKEGAGHKLISEVAAAHFEAEWRAEVHAASADVLAREHDLTLIAYWSRQQMREDEQVPDLPAEPRVTLAALKSAVSETRSQSVDSRAVRRMPVLAWDTLVEIYGGQEILLGRIQELQSSDEDVPTDLAELIQKYVDGWRPRAFGGRDEVGRGNGALTASVRPTWRERGARGALVARA